jgi:hypothetical protein
MQGQAADAVNRRDDVEEVVDNKTNLYSSSHEWVRNPL